MQRVGEFEKVSYKEFSKAIKHEFGMDDCKIKSAYEGFNLPSRATSGSAGYDFESPVSFTLEPGASIKIPTGIHVRIEEGWWLCCAPRSGMGSKYRMQLDNTIGVIDSDYYYSDNEGHIYAKITNDNREGKSLSVKAGDRFLQGIFVPFGIANADMAEGVRNGGHGSTGA